MKDIRLCKVWIKYQIGTFHEEEMYLDIDSSIKDQVYKKFGKRFYGKMQDWRIISFKWQEK